MPKQISVQVGWTIRDVVINGTGVLSTANWDAILQANGFNTWTPALLPGQLITIPDGLTTDSNAYAQMQSYPSCNSIVSNSLAVLQQVWNLITNRWILRTGFWDDTGVWDDTAQWID